LRFDESQRCSCENAFFDNEIEPIRWYRSYSAAGPYLGRQVVRGVSPEVTRRLSHKEAINRWVLKYSPQLEKAFHRRKQPVWMRWRMDETYIRVRGHWRYLYRAVDKTGQTALSYMAPPATSIYDNASAKVRSRGSPCGMSSHRIVSSTRCSGWPHSESSPAAPHPPLSFCNITWDQDATAWLPSCRR
jgi:DDE superfamily endonuclease